MIALVHQTTNEAVVNYYNNNEEIHENQRKKIYNYVNRCFVMKQKYLFFIIVYYNMNCDKRKIYWFYINSETMKIVKIGDEFGKRMIDTISEDDISKESYHVNGNYYYVDMEDAECLEELCSLIVKKKEIK